MVCSAPWNMFVEKLCQGSINVLFNISLPDRSVAILWKPLRCLHFKASSLERWVFHYTG